MSWKININSVSGDCLSTLLRLPHMIHFQRLQHDSTLWHIPPIIENTGVPHITRFQKSGEFVEKGEDVAALSCDNSSAGPFIQRKIAVCSWQQFTSWPIGTELVTCGMRPSHSSPEHLYSIILPDYVLWSTALNFLNHTSSSTSVVWCTDTLFSTVSMLVYCIECYNEQATHTHASCWEELDHLFV